MKWQSFPRSAAAELGVWAPALAAHECTLVWSGQSCTLPKPFLPLFYANIAYLIVYTSLKAHCTKAGNLERRRSHACAADVARPSFMGGPWAAVCRLLTSVLSA